jgi:hypothetical protein
MEVYVTNYSYKPNLEIKNSEDENIWSFKRHYFYILTHGTRRHTYINRKYRLTTAAMRFLSSTKSNRRDNEKNIREKFKINAFKNK